MLHRVFRRIEAGVEDDDLAEHPFIGKRLSHGLHQGVAVARIGIEIVGHSIDIVLAEIIEHAYPRVIRREEEGRGNQLLYGQILYR